uniref:Ribosome biogenesis protein SLX9 n=1 Tax=Blastobotrys adeninivorans TaxID=409370 RepID=A0A060SY91_BLAAD
MAPLIRKKKARADKTEAAVPAVPSLPFPSGQVTKKAKREAKSTAFRTRLAENQSISKSAQRRRNRKQKSNLQGNIGDLLLTLPEVEELKQQAFVAKPVRPLNPKASSKSHKKVVSNEIDRFNKVVNDSSYRSNPFDTLKAYISQKIERKPEFEKKDKMQL